MNPDALTDFKQLFPKRNGLGSERRLLNTLISDAVRFLQSLEHVISFKMLFILYIPARISCTWRCLLPPSLFNSATIDGRQLMMPVLCAALSVWL